jgi:hypothetical protein
MNNQENLKAIKQANKEMLISLLSFEHFKNLYDNYADELNYSLGISDYLINIAEELINSKDYKDAEDFCINNGHNRIWDYFHETRSECLDWYFLDKARAIINSTYKINATI